MKKPNEILRGVKESFRTRRFSVGAYSVFAVILVLAIAVALNLAVGAIPISKTQTDMTAEQVYSLSEQTEQRLGALTQDVEVYWIVREGTEDPTLEQILARYADHKHVSVKSVDPVVYPNFAAAYTAETVSDNSLIVVSDQRSLYVPYDEIWTYSDFEQYQYYLQYYGQEYRDTFVGEQKLTGAIAYVTGEELPVLYCLTGHGESALSDSLESVVTLQNYEVQELNLLTVEAVPDDCDILYIAGPTRDLTESETEAIRAYAASGGKLCVSTEYTDEVMPNFGALLADWGLSVQNGIVLDADSRYVSYGYVDLLLPTLQSHSITSPLAADGLSILFPDAQGIVMGETGEDITVSSLLKSSASSYLKTDLLGSADYEQTADDPAGPFVLAAAGTNSKTGAKLVLLGSSHFMESDYSDMVAGANQDMFLNCLDWLCGHTDSISIRPKTLTVDTLTFSAGAGRAVTALVLLVLPLGFLLAGVVTVVKRRRS